MLDKYAENPLVLEVYVDEVEKEACSARHFMGFGFSQVMPYYVPGTILLLPSTASGGRKVTVTGICLVVLIVCANRLYILI